MNDDDEPRLFDLPEEEPDRPPPDSRYERIPISRGHPSTSHEMAAVTGVAYAAERGRILYYAAERPRGVTCAECADALGIVRNQAAISFQWLRDHAWLEYVSDQRPRDDLDEGLDDEGRLVRRTGVRTRGLVQRLPRSACQDYARWRSYRAQGLEDDDAG